MNNSNFGKFEKRAGSSFGAVMMIAHEARQRVLACDNKILDSQAIEWVVNGVEPKTVISNQSHKISYMKSVLSGIDNIEIIKSVVASIKESTKQLKELKKSTKNNIRNKINLADFVMFVYYDLSESDKSRVRILVRMILDNYES